MEIAKNFCTGAVLLPEPPPGQLPTPVDVYMDLLTPSPLGIQGGEGGVERIAQRFWRPLGDTKNIKASTPTRKSGSGSRCLSNIAAGSVLG